jgi:hypothetical protein
MRNAVGAPELLSRRIFAPVLATFVFAMPWTYHSVVADEGAMVTLQITGGAGGEWTLQREGIDWRLYTGARETPNGASHARSEHRLALIYEGYHELGGGAARAHRRRRSLRQSRAADGLRDRLRARRHVHPIEARTLQ